LQNETELTDALAGAVAAAISSGQEACLVEIESFQGFFSYSHHDAETDPDLVEAFTLDLEKRVSGKFTNAKFSIWRDIQNLRTGDRWDDRIGEAVRASSVLIVLLTPKWIESDYCRKEYSIFTDEVEITRDVGEYVFAILARNIEQQVQFFFPTQANIHTSLKKRQYQKALASDFLQLNRDERKSLVDKLSDDLAGMIERLRKLPKRPAQSSGGSTQHARKHPAEFNSLPYNLREVDFVVGTEVVIDKPKGDQPRAVLAHVGFIDRLYVQTERARVEFGIRRCFLSIDDSGTGKLGRIDALRAGSDQTMRYVTFQQFPTALTVCVTAEGTRSLGALPMAPAEGENYLSKVGILSADGEPNSLRAELSISISPEGLFIAGEEGQNLSVRARKKIEAIMGVLSERDLNGKATGRFNRSVPVRERG
jgi:TIR domain